MTLLLDHNLSRRVATNVQDLFPGSTHVQPCGLERAEDHQVWEYARDEGLTILTKDSDFYDLSLALGSPPKVIWLRMGNQTRSETERIIRLHERAFRAFDADDGAAVLIIR